MSAHVRLITLWNTLVEPDESVHDSDARWRAKLLTSFTLVSLWLILPLLLFIPILFGEFVLNHLLTFGVSIGIQCIVFMLARQGRYVEAALIDVIAGSVLIFLWALVLQDPPSYTPFLYLSAVFIFVVTFLPFAYAVILAFVGLLSLLISGIVFSELPLDVIIRYPLTFNLLLIIMTLFLAHYFNQRFRYQQGKLQASEERYRTISELISDYAFSHQVDENGNLIPDWITDSFYKITGYSLSEIQEFHRNSTLYHPDDRDRVERDIQRLLRGEQTDEEYRLIHKDGSVIWVRIFRRPIIDEVTGRVIRLYGVAKNITWRKDTEVSLKASEERYRNISEMISDYAFAVTVDEQGKQILNWITESFTRITGFSNEEAIHSGKDLIFFHPDDRERSRNDINEVIAGKAVSADYRILTKAGEVRWVKIYRRPVWDEKEQRVTRFYGVAQDITEQKQMTDVLRISEERYRLISELVLGYAFSVRLNADGSLSSEWRTGELYERATGYKADELATRYEGAQYPLYDPDDWPDVESAIQRTLAGENTIEEHRIITKSGETRWLQVFRMPVWDEQEQRYTRFYGAALDITDLKRGEEQKLKLVLEQERLKLMSQFVLAISHEFRTTISNIETSRYLIERRLDDEPRALVQPKLNAIHDSVVRLREQLDNLGTVSTLSDQERTQIDLITLVQIVLLEQNERIAKDKFQINFESPSSPLTVLVDRSRLLAAIRQLVLNAMNHSAEGGQIEVSIEVKQQNAVLCVIDHGQGITSDHLPYIFDYFYRNDPARPLHDGGVGLGLSIVKMVAESHGGYIEVESQPGIGSMFRLYLPLVSQKQNA